MRAVSLAFQPVRILFVDDEETMLDFYRTSLSIDGDTHPLFEDIRKMAMSLYDETGAVPEVQGFRVPGFELTCCGNQDDAEAAVNQAVKTDRPFAAAFIDIHIPPGPSGIGIAEKIRQLDPHIEIVIVSSYPNINAVEIARRIPPAHKLLFIRKPFYLQELLQSTLALVSKWLVEMEFIGIQTDLEKRVRERTAALRKERNFISVVFDTMGAYVVVLDKDGRIVRLNRSCEQMLGHKFRDVKGKKIWNLFKSSQDCLQARKIYDNCQQGNFTQKHETYWSTASGKDNAITWSNTAILNEKKRMEYAVWIGLDITERKRAEEALRSSEERYKALIENVKEGVALIQNEKLVFANDAFVEMFEYKDAFELIGKPVNALVKNHFEPKFSDFLKTTINQKSWGLPFRGKCLTKSGREFWAEKVSSVISHKGDPAILVTVRDITENMLWEQTIKQEAEYFRSETMKLKSSIGERYRFGDIIGKSQAMQKVYEMILKAASTDANVIVFGKSGTGKELVARAIHDMSDRAQNAFVPVHCGAIPENLIESEFFGYKRGAFTGANSDKQGYLAAADKGTLFLDEVGDIGLNMQVKLLRALESGEYTPVGDNKHRTSGFRMIAATNKDPLDMVNHGKMREDFFYRISVLPINLPLLKERKEDIPLLVEHFLQSYYQGEPHSPLPAKVIDALIRYDWPGNVRELQNVLQRYLAVKSLNFMNIPSHDADSPGIVYQEDDFKLTGMDYKKTLEHVEKKLILKTLESTRWNRTRAAETLGISRRSLFRRMTKLNI